MSDTAPESPLETQPTSPPREEESFTRFLIKLAVIVLVLRSFVFSPFNIPSESMLPRLENGDYLLASKWAYGVSRYSLPFSVPLIPGRLFPSTPDRGDVVIFKAPPLNETDYIKRVIGLPGDQIQMIGGVLHLNGQPVKKQKIADFEIAQSPNTRCFLPEFEAKAQDGTPVCRYPQYRETLPEGRSYAVLDLGITQQDDTKVYIVPEDHLFLMGDNRDNSLDSRFDAVPGGGVGIVPQGNLVGKASVMMFSTDGSAQWLLPWTWFTAARWDRIGAAI